MYFTLPKSQDRINLLYHDAQTPPMQQREQEHNDYYTIASNKGSSSSSFDLNNNNMTVTEERISEIIHNLDEHWGSPPILTPNTLAHILNHQWVQQSETQADAIINREEIRKVSKAAAAVASVAASKAAQNNNKLILTLIEEFIRTIRSMDVENKFDITAEIQADPILQNLTAVKEGQLDSISGVAASSTNRTNLDNYHSRIGENVMRHLIDLLRKHNDSSGRQDTIQHGRV